MLCLNPTPSFMVSCWSSFSFIVLITIYNCAFDYVIPHSMSPPIGGEQGVSLFLSVYPWGQSWCLGQSRYSRNMWRAKHRWAHSAALIDLYSCGPPLPWPGGYTRAEPLAVDTVPPSSQLPSPVGLAGCKAPPTPREQELPVGSGAGPLGSRPPSGSNPPCSFFPTAENSPAPANANWAGACLVVHAARQLACFCLFTSPGPFHNTL